MSKLDEMNAIYSIPAPFVDQFYITPLGNVIRISFVETMQEFGAITARSAVALTPDGLISLHSLLGQVVDMIEKGKQKEAEKEESKTAQPGEDKKDEVLH